MKKIFMDQEYCIGCGLCELACIQVHSQSQDLIIAYTEERPQGLKSSKNVVKNGAMCASIGCRHCAEPACVEACIAGALVRNPSTGRTEYDKTKCVGCWSCLMACPYGAITRNPEDHTITKCDRCADRDMPACVQACPNHVLVYEER